ncbi:MAG: phytanoyl-CoA dioxygenase family protein [Candidatus Poribacteria bacterium]|nr:phytanoyl-CoA dioxygenase family protein [Candidatus Poribacteria bacterium]
MATTTLNEIKPFVESNDILAEPEQLRARARRDGYLFFRHLIPPDTVLQLRRDFLAVCDRHGWIKPGTDMMDGIRNGGPYMEGQDEYWPVLDDFQRMESFHTFAHYPSIIDVCTKLFGEPTLAHPRNIGRIMFPENTKYTTPAHQDYIHIQGTEETYTAWIPLGDCSQHFGSLAVLAGSHKFGVLPTKAAHGAGGLGVETDHLNLTWVSTDYRMGDVLLFQSLTVHKALPNQTRNRLRLSVDYRYQGQSQPITAGSLLPHFNRMSWAEIYQGWKSTKYQYYWKDLHPQIVPFTRKYHNVRR